MLSSMHREATAPVSIADEIERLCSLGPEAQGEIDDSLLRANLQLTACERLAAAARAADGVAALRAGLRIAPAHE